MATKRQKTILSLFQSAAAVVATASVVATPPAAILRSSDPDVQAFYDSLTSSERIAHEIAIDKLGTSYDVTRTHGFTKWKRSNTG